jgi:hypothetical protein
VYIYHISLMRSPVVGQLGRFHAEAVVDGAVIDICVPGSRLWPAD